jgi:SAM-dependent methyltransferase
MECDACGAWYLDPRPHVSTLGIIYPPDYYAYVRDALDDAGASDRPRPGLFARLGSALFTRRIQPIARHIALGPGTRWLDVGCGGGLSLQSLLDAFGVRGTGIDLSPRALEACRRLGFTAHAFRF